MNAMTMSGHDAEEIVEEEDAYLQQLEDAMEEELARVRKKLNEKDGVKIDDHIQLESTINDHDSASNCAIILDDPSNKSSEAAEDDDADYTPEKRLQSKFRQEWLHFQCDGLSDISLSDVEGKWKKLRHHFWNFVNADSDSQCRPYSNHDAEYILNPQLYIDFITNDDDDDDDDEDNDNDEPTAQQIGLFAGRDFESGEQVYSQKANALFFQDVSMWIQFLHSLPSSSSSSQEDACLALKWSFMKQIASPGRWILGLVVDEGGFMRRLEEDEKEEGNVALEDERSFYYMASRDIEKGEEIILSATTAK